MTPAEDLAEVRALLERMVALAKASKTSWCLTDGWHSQEWLDDMIRGEQDDTAFIAAASPDLLLRVAREALGVLDRHFPASAPAYCGECESEDSQPVDWPCPEVESVLRAWQP